MSDNPTPRTRSSRTAASAASKELSARNATAKPKPKSETAVARVEPIEARVAELLTERDLVLNKGLLDGVEIGMRFKIINPRGTEIRDPASGEVLGSVELVKVVVKVVSVQPKLSVARTFMTVDVPGTGFLGASTYGLGNLAATLGSPASKRVETLRSSEKFAQEDLDESQSYVKKNDPAVQIISTDGIDF